MAKNLQLKGDKTNPYHLSVGMVVKIKGKLAIIKKVDGTYTLPRETTYLNESYAETLQRGLKEELGAEILAVKRFLGSIISHFNREDKTEIEKTTLYFEVDANINQNTNPEKDEEEDEIHLVELEKAHALLKQQNNTEYKLLER